MTHATMRTIAKERQLDWLLAEVLGAPPAAARTPAWPPRPWLAAAVVVLGLGVAFGTALLRQPDPTTPAQDPVEAIEWHECHGPGQIDAIPADVTNLKCFDFDDAAIVRLIGFAELQRLDLSGMDVNGRGYATSLPITDAGIRPLENLVQLQWLSLAGCHEVKGETLRALESLPRLAHLDLTYTGVQSPAVERLANLPRLQELSLSYCMQFHGRSLAEVARLPGLRRLELRGCTTLSAADVMHLARLTQLRHLDLRDCQGRYRGQRAAMLDDVTAGEEREPPPPPPVEDGIGITDASVAALVDLPLATLLLGGSESLTDAIGATIARMGTLRRLDLSNLPQTTGALLAMVPVGLQSLDLSDNEQYGDAELSRLPALPELRHLALGGMPLLTDAGIVAQLAGRRLVTLSLRGLTETGKGADRRQRRMLMGDVVDAIAAQPDLRELDLSRTAFLDGPQMAQIAGLPALERLDLTSCLLPPGVLIRLAQSGSLRSLTLTWCLGLDPDALAAVGVHLRELDLYGTGLAPADIRALARTWPGCTVKLPDGQLLRVP